MAHRSSLYTVCGRALVLGGLLMFAAFALQPHVPAGLAVAAEKGLDKWVLANWLSMVAAVALLGGWIGLTHHLDDAIVEGWSTLGQGGVIIGCVGIAVASAIGAEALPNILTLYTDRSSDAAAQSYLTISVIINALSLMAWTLFWIGTAFTGLAIAEDDEYPRWLGYAGLSIAVIEIAADFLGSNSRVADLVGLVGCIWIMAVGVIFTRIEHPVRSEA